MFISSSERPFPRASLLVLGGWLFSALLAFGCDDSGDYLLRYRREPPATGRGARLLAFGAGTPGSVAELESIAAALETDPTLVFDGLVVDFGTQQSFLTSTPYDKSGTEAGAMSERLQRSPFDRLSHSLARVEVQPGDIDWRNEAHVETMANNLAAIFERARAAGLAGVLLDTQTYWQNVFSLPDVAPDGSHAELDRFVYEASRRIFATAFPRYPTARVLLTLGYAEVWREVCLQGVPIAEARYGLLPAFLRGLTEEAERAGASVYDGFLPAYPVRSVREYEVLFAAIRGDDAILRDAWVPGIVTYRWPRNFPEEEGAWAWPATYEERCDAETHALVRVGLPAGMAVMIDYGMDRGEFRTDPARFTENTLTPAELRALLARALEDADGDVWLWGSGVDFFGRTTRGLTPLPPEYRDAIRQARVVIPTEEP